MKPVFLIVAFIVFSLQISAQSKIGYVDSDAIMGQLPDAQDARTQLDELIREWQSELTRLQSEWKTKYDDYERRKLMLSDQARAEIEAQLIQMEKEIVSYREKKFGTNGELFQKQDELMKPVQNKVFNLIQKIAKDENYDFILDRSGGVLVLYAKEEHDITAKVLQELINK
ncbi:MAG: OmpH family outer membrane protein [Ignavibacteriaceae bacterium]|nr:OmpH family outer membrane protein [Ignavibacteriaceae bacterium]